MIPTGPSLPMIDRRSSVPIGTHQGDLIEIIVMIREMEQFIRRPIRGELEAQVSITLVFHIRANKLNHRIWKVLDQALRAVLQIMV